MRYIIYGAGAIGGSIGARLFQAGHEVILICRGDHLAAIRQDGLRLRAPDVDARFPVAAVGHPREIDFRTDDAVILTMKTQDTERALFDLETSGGSDVRVICTQNGVENERLAARRFARVYAMLVAMPASYLVAGEVIAEAIPISGVHHIGRFPAGVDAFAERVAADISRSTLLSEADPRIMRLKYTKLLANVGNAIQVITGFMRGSAENTALMTAVRQEAVDVYNAAGIDFASDEEYTERVQRHLKQGQVEGWLRGGSSTWQSLMRGHTTVEVDYLNGEIVLLGALHGVPAPINSVLRRTAVAMAAAGHKPGHHSFEELQAMIAAERARAGAPAGEGVR